MVWIFEIGVLTVLAVALRRLLNLGHHPALDEERAPRYRRPASSPLCAPLASEIEGHTSILGVLLNDVINEYNAGRTELARRMLAVFDSERERLVELIVSLQNLSITYLPAVRYSIEVRPLNHEAFRSRLVSDLVKSHRGLEQFTFRSKLRFQLRLRMMRRASALLNESFEELQYHAETGAEPFAWVLSQLDLCFHDLDLLTKETLLALNAELAGLSGDTVTEAAAELTALTRQQSVLETLGSPVQR